MNVPATSEHELAAEFAAGTPFDVSGCVTEAIHLLGNIQSYGALVAVSEPDLVVEVVSDNVATVLGVPAERLLGRSVADALGGNYHARLDEFRATGGPPGKSLVPVTVTGSGRPMQFDVALHRSDGLLIGEFEPVPAHRDDLPTAFLASLRESMIYLRDARTAAELCQAAVGQIRRLTGYHRVVAYRFDGDGPGEVIAEEADDGWERWLGLWFPASDVPLPARRLYLRHWLRTVADVHDGGSRLEPPIVPATGRPLDLSGSVLRTVSPFHLEYLRNIGVAASMSISLIAADHLWGLIACHHGAPLRLSPERRAACEFLGAALSLQLARLDERDRARQVAARRETLNHLVSRRTDDFPGQLGEPDSGLLELVDAAGLHLSIRGFTAEHGLVPGAADLGRILAAAARAAARAAAGSGASGVGVPWATDHLTGVDPELAGAAEVASGALVLPVSAAGDVIAWFRPEWTHVNRWAIDPNRPVVTDARGNRLSPRGSSMVWQEIIRGRSTAWTAADLQIAAELWRSVVEVELGRAQRLAEVNLELTRSNSDLDSFAFAVSHDLKEPLRGIANYATFVLEDATGLDDESRRRLRTMTRLAERMDDLLNALLHFSQLGHADISRTPVDLDHVVDQALELVAARLSTAKVELRRPQPLPAVTGDPALLCEVFTNLLTNATKYATGDGRWIEIGSGPADPPDGGPATPALYVRDNGIGIPEQFHLEIFDMFRRLHPGNGDEGGAGIGLAIARRIVERHSGQMWVQSAPGQGSTFWFTIPTRLAGPASSSPYGRGTVPAARNSLA